MLELEQMALLGDQEAARQLTEAGCCCHVLIVVGMQSLRRVFQADRLHIVGRR